MYWSDMEQAIKDAENTIRCGDHAVARLSRLMVGRLHLLPADTLADLKKELRRYNIHTGEWKK